MLLLKRLPQLMMVMLMMSADTYGHTVCSAVSTVRETTVTCLFGKDISQQGFTVLFFPTPRSNGEMVLACNAQPSGRLICDKRKDVKFDETQQVTDQLTLTRPPSENTLGLQYMCEGVPRVEDVNRCSVVDAAIVLPATTKENILSQGKDGTELFPIVNFALIIVCAIAVIICVTWYIKRHRQTSTKDPETGGSPPTKETPQETSSEQPAKDLQDSNTTAQETQHGDENKAQDKPGSSVTGDETEDINFFLHPMRWMRKKRSSPRTEQPSEGGKTEDTAVQEPLLASNPKMNRDPSGTSGQ